MACLAQQFTGLSRCPSISTPQLSKTLYAKHGIGNCKPRKFRIVAAMPISNAQTRERQKLKDMFDEAYERCRMAPMEGVSFTAEDFHSAIEKYDFNSEMGTKYYRCPMLAEITPKSNKYTFSCDGHTLNFLLDSGFVFLAVTDEASGRSLPFVFLERVKDDFKQRYAASINNDDPHPLADEYDCDDDLFEDRFSITYNLDREFGPKLKEHMQYCMNHHEEISKLTKVKSQISEVKGIMMDNIEKGFEAYVGLCVLGKKRKDK